MLVHLNVTRVDYLPFGSVFAFKNGWRNSDSVREVIRRALRLKQLSLPRLVGIICPDNWEGPPQSWPESPESQGLCWAGSLLGSPQCKPSGGSDFLCWLLHSLCPLLSAQDEILKVRTDTKLNFNLEKSRVKELVCSFIKSKSLIYFFSEWNACWSLSLLCKIQLSLDTRPFIRVHNLSLNFNYISHQIPRIGGPRSPSCSSLFSRSLVRVCHSRGWS